jgi:hypothetical protein
MDFTNYNKLHWSSPGSTGCKHPEVKSRSGFSLFHPPSIHDTN